jgi:membrane protein
VTRPHALTNVRRVVVAAARGYGLHGLGQQSAAIAFRVLFSLVPLVALTVSLLDLVLPERFSERLVDWVVGELLGSPQLEESVGNLLGKGTVTPSVTGLLALAALLWAASSMMGSIRLAFQAIWTAAPRRPYVRAKLVDAALALTVGIVAIAAYGLGIVAQSLAQLGGDLGDALGLTRADDWTGEAFGTVSSFALVFVCLLGLYRVAPPVRPHWTSIAAGAVVAAVGFEVATSLYGWYLTWSGELAAVYGSLAVLLGFLLVVYAGAVTMLVGAEIVADIDAT